MGCWYCVARGKKTTCLFFDWGRGLTQVGDEMKLGRLRFEVRVAQLRAALARSVQI